ncbi:hypothetical protein SESBI_35648 [Sesbania bispinosa]|nr:hypothetical protein SESBI_35648 [Sesbania bispinosa]
MSDNQDHHRLLTEEEDLVHRSAKKIKDSSSTVMDVEASNVKEAPNVSYRDKVLETEPSLELQPEEIVRMATEELFPDMDISNNNDHGDMEFDLNPNVHVEFEEYENWCGPWKYSLIVRLMGKRNPVDNSTPNSAAAQHVQSISNDMQGSTPQEKKHQADGDEALFGPWMLAKKISRKRPQANPQSASLEPKAHEIREVKDKQKNDDWEKEVLAIMSRYNTMRWEAHSRGEFVGDPLSMDNQHFKSLTYGNSSDSNMQDVVPTSNLDRPPDTTREKGKEFVSDGKEGAKTFPGLIRDLTRMCHLNFVALLEPRISGEKVDTAIKRMGFSGGVRVEAHGFSGGIWIMWKSEALTVKVHRGTVKERLEIVVCSSSWRMTFQQASVVRIQKPFKFLAFRLSHPDFQEQVKTVDSRQRMVPELKKLSG